MKPALSHPQVLQEDSVGIVWMTSKETKEDAEENDNI
jgi:hypothetical protein